MEKGDRGDSLLLQDGASLKIKIKIKIKSKSPASAARMPPPLIKGATACFASFESANAAAS
ncbi:hypothetical protein CNO08_11320 [Lysobacter capsici]|nr:hypothetical protein CNO08_11320 [Lysobacter capsici]